MYFMRYKNGHPASFGYLEEMASRILFFMMRSKAILSSIYARYFIKFEFDENRFHIRKEGSPEFLAHAIEFSRMQDRDFPIHSIGLLFDEKVFKSIEVGEEEKNHFLKFKRLIFKRIIENQLPFSVYNTNGSNFYIGEEDEEDDTTIIN